MVRPKALNFLPPDGPPLGFRGCDKNILGTENIFLREESIGKTKNNKKKIMVGDLNLGTVGNRKHTYFFVWPDEEGQRLVLARPLFYS